MFADVISDFVGREEYKQDSLSEAFRSFSNNIFRGKKTFKAKVLSGCEQGFQAQDSKDPSNLFFPIVVRILGIHDRIIPDPDETPQQRKVLDNMNVVCYPDRHWNQKLGMVPQAVQIIDVLLDKFEWAMKC